MILSKALCPFTLRSMSASSRFSSTTLSGGDHVAVLVDTENTSINVVKNLIKEVHRVGLRPVCRRLYGNFDTNTSLKNWKEASKKGNDLSTFELVPTNKLPMEKHGCSDISLTVDVMSILGCYNLKGFFLVTSDSDFVPLVKAMTRAGKVAVVVGKAGQIRRWKPLAEQGRFHVCADTCTAGSLSPIIRASMVAIMEQETENEKTGKVKAAEGQPLNRLTSEESTAQSLNETESSVSKEDEKKMKQAIQKYMKKDGWADISSIASSCKLTKKTVKAKYGRSSLVKLLEKCKTFSLKRNRSNVAIKLND